MITWLGTGSFLATLHATDVAGKAEWDTFSDTWVATDGLGRRLPESVEVGPARTNRTVGIFYFLWLQGQHPVYDLSRILGASSSTPDYGPPGSFHFWAEPVFGHYRSDDEFVLRKHAQMLSDAGVDVVAFDVTNGLVYEPTYLALCRVWSAMRRQGQQTPQIMFLANAGHQKVVTALWHKLYSQNLYRDLWFCWQGRPLLLTPAEGLTAALTNFFTLRQSWAWSDPRSWFGNGRDKWPFMDHAPQQIGWHESPDKPEQVSVTVAQHPTSNIGRSFHRGQQPAADAVQPALGLNFAEQWEHALRVNAPFVFVTGWNEWIAQRFLSDGTQSFLGRVLPKGETYFVDEYNQEYSRDIEPMRGGHGDNYYYQLVNYVRRYKGARSSPPVGRRPITIDGKFDDWRGVVPEFRDTLGDPVRRNHPGWKGEPGFVNSSGRNDLMAAKLSADATNVYFYVRTADPLTPHTDANWMLLFIDVDQNPATGWLGYDFVLNRTNVQDHLTILEHSSGRGYGWSHPVEVKYHVAGRELEVALPRTVLGLTNEEFVLDFKWADNLQQTGEWSDFTLNGDAAPNDRFNYRARFKREECNSSGNSVARKP